MGRQQGKSVAGLVQAGGFYRSPHTGVNDLTSELG
jgi:hypothetical protein